MSEKVKSVFSLEDLGISTKEEDQAIMPSGGEVFGAGTFVAPFFTSIFAFFMSQENITDYNEDADDEDKLPLPRFKDEAGDWYRYFYDDFDTATEVRRALEGSKKARATQHFAIWCETSRIINASDLEAVIKGFGQTIRLDDSVQALRVGHTKSQYGNLVHRHEWNFITLPTLVAAAADIMNIANDGYDISDLVAERDDSDYTQEWFEILCGVPTGDYVDADLFKRRAKLWKSLGEDNPLQSARIGARTVSGKPNKLATTSDALSKCLTFASGKWDRPLWLRMAMVPDPRPDAVSSSGNRLSVPAIIEFFGPGDVGEVGAREVVKEEMESAGGALSHPPMPPNWAGANTTPEQLAQWFNDEFYGKIAKLPEDQWVGRASFDTLDNLKAWLSWAEG